MEDSLNYIQTKDDLRFTLEALDYLHKFLYQTEEERKKFKEEKARSNEYIYIPAWIEEELEIREKVNDKDKFIKDLQDYLKGLEVMKITLAYSPDRDGIEEIASWIRENISKRIILDFRENTALMGGCTFSLEGKYVDMSLSRQIDDWFEGKRGIERDQVHKVDKKDMTSSQSDSVSP